MREQDLQQADFASASSRLDNSPLLYLPFASVIRLGSANGAPQDGQRLKVFSTTPRGGRNSEHYRQIGHALTICEAGSPGVGIPWVPPTARAKTLRLLYTELHPQDFIRITLSTVTTESLSSYAEDLETLPFDSSARDTLHIPLSNFERSGASVLTAVTVFALSYYLLLAVSIAPVLAAAASVVPAFTLAIVVRVISSEKFRRRSFRLILGEEISRRTGGSDSPLKPIKLREVLYAVLRPRPRPTATGA